MIKVGLTAESLKQQLLPLWQDFEGQMLERISPIVESLRPIWSDPLWQFIGLIIASLILLVLAFWIFRTSAGLFATLTKKIVGFFSSCVSALKSLISGGVKKAQEKKKEEKQSWRWLNHVNIREGMDVVRYLTTRRDWRYKSPWYLLAGHDNSGKTAWIKSIKNGVRTQLLVREKQLLSNGSNWHFFDDGVIIDVDNEKSFPQTVELLNCYRPERPVDGVILTISANDLINASTSTQRRKLGEALYQQLWALQHTTGFVVPVYVQVTQCDVINGFDAFWAAHDKERLSDMFGWSNPSRLDTAYSSSWVAIAFNTVLEGVSQSQLSLAAAGKEIADVDSFILFDNEFKTLEAPLSEVMDFAFASSSFQQALPLRGIWFSGRVGEDIALTEDFLAHKLWPETHLAHPVEQRYFSANRTLRRFQIGTLATAAVLILTLVVDATRLYRYSHQAETLWAHIIESKQDQRIKAGEPYCKEDGADMWWLLSSLSEMADQPFTPSLPSSWAGGQIPALREASAKHIYETIVFPGMQCRLRGKALMLNKLALHKESKTKKIIDLDLHIDDLPFLIDELSQYQMAVKRFNYLAGPLPTDTRVAADFDDLMDYLYDGAIPSSVLFKSPLLEGAIVNADYDGDGKPTNFLDQEALLLTLNERASHVRSTLTDRVLRPPVSALQRAFFSSHNSSKTASKITSLNTGKEMVAAVDKFQLWLQYVKHKWLVSHKQSRPCDKLYEELNTLHKALSNAAFPNGPLNEFEKNVASFNEENCDDRIRHKMETMSDALLGKLFQSKGTGRLEFSAQLKRWEKELSALESLNVLSPQFNATLLSQQDTDSNTTGSNIVAWELAPLDEALNIVLAFQSYRQKWWQSTSGAKREPFYAPALRQYLHSVTQQLIHQSQVTTMSPIPKPLGAPSDPEEEIFNKVASFKRVEVLLRQLTAVLQQEGDTGNATLLRNSSRDFVLEQLHALEQLAGVNKLYRGFDNPNWLSKNFAVALYGYSDPADLGRYLASQRQQMAYLTNNLAQPLVSYLLDIGGITQTTNNSAQLWYETLLDLRRYDRKESGNSVEAVQRFITNQVSELTADNCITWLSTPEFMYQAGGLFAKRHYEIDQQLRDYCKIYSNNSVIKRYLALAERFNNELAGRFPFAPYHQAGDKDVTPKLLQTFFNDYKATWGAASKGQTLLTELDELAKAQPNLKIDKWRHFVAQLDRASTYLSGDKPLNFSLAVQFSAMPKQSVGAQQIIEWQLESADSKLIYPNGGDRIEWRPGDPLSLSLRWASGSVYTPTRDYNSQIQIDSQQHRAKVGTRGRWALFDWLQRFGQPDLTIQNGVILSFYTPVKIKQSTEGSTHAPIIVRNEKGAHEQTGEQISSQSGIQMSRVNLALKLMVTLPDKRVQALSMPINLPYFAPGLPGEKGAFVGAHVASSN